MVLWTAGEENTLGRADKRTWFGPMDTSGTSNFRGSISLMKLADEGELAVVSRREADPYRRAPEEFCLRADSPQNVTVWTAGTGTTARATQ